MYRARHQKKTGEFAVKIIPVEKFRQIEKLEQCTINEVTTLETIGTCENIVRYYERLKSKNNCYYVYEYCNGGTLMDALRKQGRFTEKQTLVILRELQ